MRYLSACGIIKNEAPYLKEWLCFHQLVGIGHFYLFDNNSTDTTRQVLRPFIRSGYVTYLRWHAHPGQMLAYEYALRSFEHETKWMAFIDADEFLHGTKEDDLNLLLQGYEAFSALAAHWKVFGTSGHDARPQGLVIENFTLRARDRFPPNGHFKSIVKLTEGIRPNDPHMFITVNGTVNESKELLDPEASPVQRKWSFGRIAVNHYFTKSREEWMAKLRRGRATVSRYDPEHIRKEEIFTDHDRNDQRDETILRFLPALRLRMAEM